MSNSEDQRLAAFRTRLDTDPALRRLFEQSPLGAMRKAGVQVSPQRARELHGELVKGRAPMLPPSAFMHRPFAMTPGFHRLLPPILRPPILPVRR